MDIKYLVIITLVVIVIFLFYLNANYEHMTSDEAIKNVASVYNTEKMVLKDLVLTGKLFLGNDFYITSDKDKGLIIGKDGVTNQFTIDNNGNLTSNNATINGTLDVSGTTKVNGLTSTNRIILPNGQLSMKDWDIDASDGHIRFKAGGGMKFSINNGGISWDNGKTLMRSGDVVRLKTNTTTNDYVFRGGNGTIYGDKSLTNAGEAGKFTITNATL